MPEDFHFRLPSWSPERLVKESVCAWGFRHLSEVPIDYETAPWPQVLGMILAYLRHTLTDFDERLRTRYEHDPKFRDEMAAQVAAAAFRQYPWLQDDPRPFPEAENSTLPLDELSRELADLHTLRDHLERAIRDLRRQGGRSDEITDLESELAETRRDIDACYGFLSAPKTLPEEGLTRAMVAAHRKIEGVDPSYHFFSDKPVTPNRIEYIGFRCPRCHVAVARWKQIVPMGQGYRCVIFSCHCLTASIYTPGGCGRIQPMTVEEWTRYCQRNKAS